MSRKQLLPGVYISGEELDVDCAELCVYFGWPPTPENLDRAGETVRDALRDLGVEPEVVEHYGLPPWVGFG